MSSTVGAGCSSALQFRYGRRCHRPGLIRRTTSPGPLTGRTCAPSARGVRGSPACPAHSSPSGAASLSADPASAAPGSAPLAGKTAGVIGGGPAGVLCAAQLARLGAAVEVFERSELQALGAVWSISLGRCAKEAIEAAGLSSDFGPELRSEGVVQHRPDGTELFAGWGLPPSAGRIAMATQRDIVTQLLAECQRVHGDAVTVTPGWQAVGGDVRAGEVVLARSGSSADVADADVAGERQTRQFDLVVGADGVNSKVRELMREHDPDMTVDIGSSAQGVVCLPLSPQGGPEAIAALPTPSGRPFHTTPADHTAPVKGSVMSFLVRDPTGKPELNLGAVNFRRAGAEVTFVVTGDQAWLKAARPEADTFAALAATFPQVPEVWLRDAAAMVQRQAAAEDITVRVPRFVQCSKIASGRAVLIGDAAHAISPNLGMGCNLALQDTLVLSNSIEAAAGDVAAAARDYTETRAASARVAARMSQRCDSWDTFRYHRNPVRLLWGLPVKAVMVSARHPILSKLPSFLKPGFAVADDMHDIGDFQKIERGVALYAAKLAATAAAAAGCAGAGLWAGTAALSAAVL